MDHESQMLMTERLFRQFDQLLESKCRGRDLDEETDRRAVAMEMAAAMVRIGLYGAADKKCCGGCHE